MTPSHYLVAYGRQGRPGTFETACRRFIKPTGHSNTPDCETCQAYLVHIAKLDAAMDELRDDSTLPARNL